LNHCSIHLPQSHASLVTACAALRPQDGFSDPHQEHMKATYIQSLSPYLMQALEPVQEFGRLLAPDFPDEWNMHLCLTTTVTRYDVSCVSVWRCALKGLFLTTVTRYDVGCVCVCVCEGVRWKVCYLDGWKMMHCGFCLVSPLSVMCWWSVEVNGPWEKCHLEKYSIT